MGFEEGEHHFYVFDIYDIDQRSYLPPHGAVQVCKEQGWDFVPVISRRLRLGEFAGSVDELLAKAEGVGLTGRKREGLVFTNMTADFRFKAIDNSWLLETGKE
ncbi:hypothetical protein F5Y15DRAFT_414237 [Xylariaceae sp. FL0016]|nr:hypothetical protein F5Y15DRAFT_414237 [Xylariaceae sp. FL0016]